MTKVATPDVWATAATNRVTPPSAKYTEGFVGGQGIGEGFANTLWWELSLYLHDGIDPFYIDEGEWGADVLWGLGTGLDALTIKPDAGVTGRISIENQNASGFVRVVAAGSVDVLSGNGVGGAGDLRVRANDGDVLVGTVGGSAGTVTVSAVETAGNSCSVVLTATSGNIDVAADGVIDVQGSSLITIQTSSNRIDIIADADDIRVSAPGNHIELTASGGRPTGEDSTHGAIPVIKTVAWSGSAVTFTPGFNGLIAWVHVVKKTNTGSGSSVTITTPTGGTVATVSTDGLDADDVATLTNFSQAAAFYGSAEAITFTPSGTNPDGSAIIFLTR